MIYVINEDVCKEKGLSPEEMLLLTAVAANPNIVEMFSKLQDDKKIIYEPISKQYLLNDSWLRKVQDILLSGDKEVPKEDRIVVLAQRLMDIFPKGLKPGTSTYWRGNKKEISLKLKKFFKLYGNKYTDEQIINATRQYVESFNGNYQYMRVLKYFIHKAVKKVGEEGNYIEEVSELASFIENEGQECLNNNWNVELV